MDQLTNGWWGMAGRETSIGKLSQSKLSQGEFFSFPILHFWCLHRILIAK